MPVKTQIIKTFNQGIHNDIDKETIPHNAASDSLGWITNDGKIELMRGRKIVGTDGVSGRILSEHFGFKTDGTAVHFRKLWTGSEGKIQYLDGSTWTDIIGGLSNKPVTFTNYSSLSGNYVYIGSPDDGLYKIVTANPGSIVDVYSSSKNFKGFNFIDRGRMIMWATENDSSGLYGSHIDGQDGDVYTTVSNESIGSSGNTNYTGNLAFKADGSTRTCFAVKFTSGNTTLTVDYTGKVDEDSNGSGTVNFATGAYDITFDSNTTGAVTVDYQWEDSNTNGVTDFTKSATRLAGEGFVVRQDVGGDSIQVVIPYEGSYFSIKESSVYQFTLSADDTNPSNQLIRTNIGVQTLQAAVGTSVGILFMDTGNPSEPRLTQLNRNPIGDNFLTQPIVPHFDFSKYSYEDVVMFNWDRYVLIACRENSKENNRILMVDFQNKTVDIAPYEASCFTQNEGKLFSGSPITQSTYQIFTGFDDLGADVNNYWESKADILGDNRLKKVKKYRFRGEINSSVVIDVYMSIDNSEFSQIGAILGTGDYVDLNTSHAIGTEVVGVGVVGGEGTETVSNFLMEIKIRQSKFRTRQLRFVARGQGYCAIQEIQDFDIWSYQEKIPRGYRIKQNLSLDGATNDQDNPEY